MARAKHTHRADARRRFRQTPDAEFEVAAPTAPATADPVRPAGARPSITAAFRNAYHHPNLRDDIAALPWLLRTRAFLVPLILIVGATGFIVIAPSNSISALLFQMLVLPPAMVPIFLVGFFAKRASYLLGGIIGTIDLAIYAGFLVAILPSSLSATPEQIRDQVLAAAAVGPTGGVLFASAAAWYRRFLALSNAGAARARQARAKARSSSGRR